MRALNLTTAKALTPSNRFPQAAAARAAGEGNLPSPKELSLLVTASHEAGLLHEAQEDAVARILAIGERRIREIMTPRNEVDWIDLDDTQEEII